jgi:hypothetical protein
MLGTSKLSYSSMSIRNAPDGQDYLMHPSQEFLRFQSYISPKSGLGVTSPGMGRFILECVVAYLSRSLVLSNPDNSLAIWLRSPFVEFDSAKSLIEAMQSSLVVLGIGRIHGFCASSEADATLS